MYETNVFSHKIVVYITNSECFEDVKIIQQIIFT